MDSLTHPYPSNPTTCGQSVVRFSTYVSDNLQAGDGIDERKIQYVPLARLREHWSGHQIQKVLDEHGLIVPVPAIRSQYLRVFSILVYINEVRYLDSAFTKRDLNDGKFPIEECPWPLEPAMSGLWARFECYQWIFFPLELHSDRLLGTRIAPKRVLPWKKQYLRGGDMATVYRIQIHEGCNMLHRGRQDQSRPKQNILALKTYTQRGVRLYENERKALEVLCTNPSDHVVAYYGSFQQMDTYNLILELANGGDLLEYLRSTPPPRTAEDIHDFWSSLTDTLKGLFRVHQATEREEHASHGRRVLILHEDLKPENILLDRLDQSASPYRFLPKIADFGCSDVRNVPLDAQDEKQQSGMDHHGSPTYSAPEISHHERYTQVGRYRMSEAADIWAMGCIFSEAAVWIAKGPEGRHDYGQLRRAETGLLSNFEGSAYGDAFHNGIEALSAVSQMHETVIEVLPPCDTVTAQILNVVQDHMLAQDLNQRWHADKLKDRIGHILDNYNSRKAEISSPKTSSSTISIDSPDRSKQTSPTAADNIQLQTPPTGAPSTTITGPFGWQTLGPSLSGITSEPCTAQSIRPSKISPSFPRTTSHASTQSGSSGPPNSPGTRRVLPQLKTMSLSPTNQGVLFDNSLSLDDVCDYRNARKKGTSAAKRVDRLVKRLHGSPLSRRDHIFFFENSQSMMQHVKEATRAFTALAYLAKQIDTNGIELVLASQPSAVHRNAHTTPLIRKLEQCDFDMSMMEDNLADFVEKVVIPRLPRANGSLLSGANGGRRASFSSAYKPLSILVFTDGQWGPNLPNAAGVEEPIRKLMRHIRLRGLNRTHIMIQFVRFGDDADGKRYLQFLDDDIGKQEQCDIVDTEPVDGNVLKMFIGSINAGMDNTIDQASASASG